MATNTKIGGTTARKLMPNKIEFGKYPAKFFHARREPTGRCLQAVMHPHADIAPAAEVQVSYQSIDLTAGDSRFRFRQRIMSPIHVASTQSLGRFDDHEINGGQRREPLDSFAATSANCCATRQEKWNIAAQVGRQTRQALLAPINLPAAIGKLQRGSRIAGTAAEAGRHGNMLEELNTGSECTAVALAEQFKRFNDKVVGTDGNIHPLRRRADRPTGPDIEDDLARCTVRRSRNGCEAYLIRKPDWNHERFEIVETISTSTQHIQEKVELGRCACRTLEVVPAEVHLHTVLGLKRSRWNVRQGAPLLSKRNLPGPFSWTWTIPLPSPLDISPGMRLPRRWVTARNEPPPQPLKAG
jgi:hypothetical protein